MNVSLPTRIPQNDDSVAMLLARMLGTPGSGTLLASASRTTTTSTTTLDFFGAKTLLVVLNVSVAGAAGGLQVLVEYEDPVSASWVRFGFNTTARTTAGQIVMALGPDLSALTNATLQAGTGVILPCPLNSKMRFTVVHSTADAYTYSLGYLAS